MKSVTDTDFFDLEATINLIDSYLKDEMSPVQKGDFIVKLNSDDNLRKIYNDIIDIREASKVILREEEWERKRKIIEFELYYLRKNLAKEPLKRTPFKQKLLKILRNCLCFLLIILVLLFVLKIIISKKQTDLKEIPKRSSEFIMSTISIPLIKFADGDPGFVSQDTIGKIVVFQKIDPNYTIRRESLSLQKSPNKSKYINDQYKLSNDTLLIIVSETDSLLRLYEFNIKKQTREEADMSGHLLHIEKPELLGFYLFMNKQFYSIEIKNDYDILSSVENKSKIELLKYYTAK